MIVKFHSKRKVLMRLEEEIDVGWGACQGGEMDTEGVSWGRGGKCRLRMARS